MKRLLATMMIIIIVFAQTSHSTPLSATTSAPISTIQGVIDGPINNTQHIGTVRIYGWAKGDVSPIVRVEIHINGQYYTDAVYGDPRAEVGGNYGWHWDWNTQAMGSGSYVFKFKAFAQDGSTIWLNNALASPNHQLHSNNPVQSCLKPFYRYINLTTNRHFYTYDWAELGVGNGIWKHQGIVGYIATTLNCHMPNALRLYRLRNASVPKYFYATEGEANSAVTNGGYTMESQLIYVSATDNKQYNTKPLYRLYNQTFNDHFYTDSPVEKASAISGGYIDEGIVGYVFDQYRVFLPYMTK